MKIVVDYRERASGLLELIREHDVFVEVKPLPFGDYIINDSITIERKTARDFLISIIDSRLFTQLSNLRKHCPCPVVLIEGNPCKTDVDIDPAAIKGALISVETIWYVPIVFTRSKEDSVETLLMMGRQDETYMDVVPLRGGYRPKRLKSRQLYILQGLPKVGPTVAKRFLERFGSVSNAMNARVEDLMEVEGIGRITAERIRRILDSKYQAT
jgi:DNA excision repair protein ERCC-4